MPNQSQFDPDAFRSLVDTAIEGQPLSSQHQVAEHFETCFNDVQPAAWTEALYSRIRTSIGLPNGTYASAGLRSLKRGLFLEGILGKSREPYLSIISTLSDACREPATRSFADQDRWIEAINAARATITLSGELRTIDPRVVSVAGAAERLIAKGFSLSVKGGRVFFDPGEMDRVCVQLEQVVVSLGGLDVIGQTVGYLTVTEPLHFGRYAPGRTFGMDRKFPSLPIGYLLQLGAKHLDARPADPDRRAELWKEIATLSSDLCAVIDVEPYSNFEAILLDAQALPENLASVALFDHLFTLKQWPPSKALELLGGITSTLDQTELRSRVGWDLHDVLGVIEAVLSAAPQPFAILRPEQLEANGVTKEIWLKLCPLFTHPLSTMNRGYLSPLNADKAEFDFKPLFELPNGHLLVVTPGLAALAFFEATTRAIRASGYPDFDNRLGDAVEGVVANALRKAGVNVTVEGIEYTTGESAQGTVAGECDVVVETDTNIVFIELKKKPLRRLSGTGDAAPAMVDLTTSLFAAQAQLSRHEQTLLATGRIDFVNGYSLEYRGRNIERIAMTWLDYGGLQDKYLLSQIFTALAGHRLSTDHPREGKKLGQLNVAIDALEKEMASLRQLGKDEGALFINCWFLSVPQLLMLLEGVEGNADFTDRIGKLRHLTYRTLDFYRDFEFARRGKVI